MKKLILLLIGMLTTISVNAQSISGKWNGFLDVYGSQLKLVFHITKTDSGYTSTMDSPSQYAMGIPVQNTQFTGDSLTLEISRIGAAYHGKLKQNSTFKGTFVQHGHSLALNLRRKDITKKKITHPQEPKPPFPYHSEDVTFINKKQDVTLAGTLTKPEQNAPFPAVILISGSGPQNRNEELVAHKPFLVISDYLTRHGIAVLRFDDRGVGQSTGNFSAATSADFATDVEAGFHYLQTKKDINPQKIGLIGHSEGGLIAPMVASKHKNIAFIVLLAGPGVPGDQLLLKQEALIAKANDVDQNEIQLTQKVNKGAFRIVKSTNNADQLDQKLTTYFKRVSRENPDFKSKNESDSAFVSRAVHDLATPWQRYFITYDPRPTLQNVSCPVLALNGSNDLQVPPAEDLAAIKKALKKGGNTNGKTQEIPGLNHLFQESETGAPSEYGKIEQTFSPKALTIMQKWIDRQVGS